MAHKEQQDYCTLIKGLFPAHFWRMRVLEIGSLDINGTVRDYFWRCSYEGIDIGPGPGVDNICAGHEFRAADGYYDVVVCCEVAEHDQYYPMTVLNAVRMLRPGGLFLFTCATTGRAEHGTTRTSPFASPYTNDYYQNVTESTIRAIPGFTDAWQFLRITVNQSSCDLQIAGIKKGMRLRFSPSLAVYIMQRLYSFYRLRVRDIGNGIKKLLQV